MQKLKGTFPLMLDQSRIPRLLIELRPTKTRVGGVGVFAASNIRKGQVIAAGVAEEDYKRLIPWREFKNFSPKLRAKIMQFCIGTSEGFIPPQNLDFNQLSIEWYMNHSCDGNVGFDENGNFVARRNVKKGSELRYDYGLAESNPAFRMRCKCGSRKCRGMVTGNDWKREDFRKKNLRYMLPRLRLGEVQPNQNRGLRSAA